MVVASYRAMKMSTSGLSVIDERVKLVDPPHRCQLTRKADVIGYSGCLYFYPLRLGNSILEHLHIYIETKSKRNRIECITPMLTSNRQAEKTWIRASFERDDSTRRYVLNDCSQPANSPPRMPASGRVLPHGSSVGG
jgi:hypothetical protein